MTTPTGAELYEQWCKSVETHVTTKDFVCDFARAVLAKWGQQPLREPLTPDEAIDAFCKTPDLRQLVQAFVAGVRFAEQHHGITKEGGQHGTE